MLGIFDVRPDGAANVAAGFKSATTRLTETILGDVEQDLAETLKAIASEIGL